MLLKYAKPIARKRFRNNAQTLYRNDVAPTTQTRSFPGGKGDLKKLGSRKRSATVIAKITNTMKLVASVKFKMAQQRAHETTPFFTTLDKFLNTTGAKTSSKDPKDQKYLSLLMTTDKGLCGPINSNLLRNMKKVAEDKTMSFILIGEKGYSGITNIGLAKGVLFSCHYGGRGEPTFNDFGAIAERAAQQEFDVCSVYYNKFVSAIDFAVKSVEIPSHATILEAQNQKKIVLYDHAEPLKQIAKDLIEFYIAAALNYTYYQTAASEMASRQNSMDSATKNAKDLIRRLRIKFNKIRQNVITNELIEITSGAQVIQGKKGKI